MGRAARERHHRRCKQPTGCPMPQSNDMSRSLAALGENDTLIAVIEMSQSSWLVAAIVPGVERHPAKKLEPSEAGRLRRLHRWREEAREAGRTIDRIAVAFEAGRDGFWLARWLPAHGIEAGACPGEGRGDPPEQHRRLAGTSPGKNRSARHGTAETELSRSAARRAGTLRHGGDPEPGRRGRQAAEPRARELLGERTRIGNRIKSTLARLGVRGFKPTLRTAAQRLERRPTPEGDPVPPNTLAELRRERARLCLLADQIREIETARLQRLEQRPNCGAHPMVRLLARGSGSWHRDCRPPTRRSRAACATAGGGALWRSDRFAGRERGAPAGERTGQACHWQRTRGRQCPGAARHDPVGLALASGALSTRST
jgi:transposase